MARTSTQYDLHDVDLAGARGLIIVRPDDTIGYRIGMVAYRCVCPSWRNADGV
jgi:hypothetical protein